MFIVGTKQGPVEVSRERVEDLLCNAVEGGSSYWAESLRAKIAKTTPKGTLDLYSRMIDGGFVILHDQDDRAEVNPNDIAIALQVMADKYPRHFNDFITEHDDGDTADVFLQVCCFREIVYG